MVRVVAVEMICGSCVVVVVVLMAVMARGTMMVMVIQYRRLW